MPAVAIPKIRFRNKAGMSRWRWARRRRTTPSTTKQPEMTLINVYRALAARSEVDATRRGSRALRAEKKKAASAD